MLLVGDSLAVGMTPYAHARHVNAVIGRGSKSGAHAALRFGDRVALVSLGANDPARPSRGLRRRFRGRVRMVLLHRSCVAWLTVPSRPWVLRGLRSVRRRDARLRVVSVSGLRRVDGVHLTSAGYRVAARRLVSACRRS
jgi:hypothetical protein